MFSLGVEGNLEVTDIAGHRMDMKAYELLGGPSLQWHPVPAAHIDLVALFGAEVERGGDTVPLAEPTLIIGWEF